MKWRISGQGYKHLTSFSWFPLFKPVDIVTLLHSASSCLFTVSFSLVSPDEVLKSNKLSHKTACWFFQPLSGGNKKEIVYTMISRVIVVQDFEIVTCSALFVYKPTFSVIFCWINRVRVSRKLTSLFIPYISTAKPISLVRGYIEVKISKHDIW